jgi:hypothetical protein
MALFNRKTQVIKYKQVGNFDPQKLTTFCDTNSLHRPFTLYQIPTLHYRMVFDKLPTANISVYSNLELKDYKLNADKARKIANSFESSDYEHVTVYLDADTNVVLYGDGLKQKCPDNIFAKLPTINLHMLHKFENSSKEEKANYLLVDESKYTFALITSFNPRLYTPLFERWLLFSFPNLKVNDDQFIMEKDVYRLFFDYYLKCVESGYSVATTGLPYKFAYGINHDELKRQVEAIKLDDKQLQNLPKELKGSIPKEITSTPVTKDKSLSQEIREYGIYNSDIITDINDFNFDDDICEVSWTVFLNNYEYLPTYCVIYLAPNEVILDRHNRVILWSKELKSMHYYDDKKTCLLHLEFLSVVPAGKRVKLILDYFKEMLGIEAVKFTLVKTEENKNASLLS